MPSTLANDLRWRQAEVHPRVAVIWTQAWAWQLPPIHCIMYHSRLADNRSRYTHHSLRVLQTKFLHKSTVIYLQQYVFLPSWTAMNSRCYTFGAFPRPGMRVEYFDSGITSSARRALEKNRVHMTKNMTTHWTFLQLLAAPSHRALDRVPRLVGSTDPVFLLEMCLVGVDWGGDCRAFPYGTSNIFLFHYLQISFRINLWRLLLRHLNLSDFSSCWFLRECGRPRLRIKPRRNVGHQWRLATVCRASLIIIRHLVDYTQCEKVSRNDTATHRRRTIKTSHQQWLSKQRTWIWTLDVDFGAVTSLSIIMRLGSADRRETYCARSRPVDWRIAVCLRYLRLWCFSCRSRIWECWCFRFLFRRNRSAAFGGRKLDLLMRG